MKLLIVHFFLPLKTLFVLGISSLSICANCMNPENLPELHHKLNQASVITSGEVLTVSTGKVERSWRFTGKGLVTIGLKDITSGRQWCTKDPAFSSDWWLPGLIEDSTSCRLVQLTAVTDNDDTFTSDHIRILAEFRYSSQIELVYEIWIFPGAPGIRTQLHAKELQGMDRSLNLKRSNKKTGDDRLEYLPVDFRNLDRRAIGYYSGTQQRNYANTEIIEEQLTTSTQLHPEIYQWPSILVAEDKTGGLCVVKESHKCVNQSGLNTGEFYVDQSGIRVSGWGLTVPDLRSDKFRETWGNWVIVYSGDSDSRELAIKEFDRIRYPVDPERDIYIMANTWGSGNQRAAAQENNVMLEIESQKDLGIDVQQIDDGWQNPVDLHWTRTTKWEPYPPTYPDGWKNVVKKANDHGITLGLWAAAGFGTPLQRNTFGDHAVKLDDLKRNFDLGGFRYYKFDFVLIQNYDDYEHVMNMTRDFVKYTNNHVRINWDVTESEPRVGYFFGREYGNTYLENRKAVNPGEQIYVPYLVLRDAWQLSKYVNLNKFQITVQNIDLCDTIFSNAHKYTHPYSVAIALMGSPLFFQETHLYSQKARDEIRPLLEIYKEHRKNMFKGYVFPIGDKPDDRSWTGFQCHNPGTSTGYLLIFRELNNKQPESQLRLRFIKNKKLVLTDLLSGKKLNVKADQNGFVPFRIENPADFKYFEFQVL